METQLPSPRNVEDYIKHKYWQLCYSATLFQSQKLHNVEWEKEAIMNGEYVTIHKQVAVAYFILYTGGKERRKISARLAGKT
jgi:hypothetical protein